MQGLHTECYDTTGLKSHMLTHNGSKLFKCDQCVFQTSQSGSLLGSHKDTHQINIAKGTTDPGVDCFDQ